MTQAPPSSFNALLNRVGQENVVHFQNGLPGFPMENRFVILQNPNDRPLAWMQSLNTERLAFVITSPFVLFPDYRPDVSEYDLALIGSPALEEVLLISIVRLVNGTPPELYVNLKAPIIINLRTFEGRQVILKNESVFSEKAVYRVKV